MSNQPNTKQNESLKGQKGRGGGNPPQGNGKPSPKVAAQPSAARPRPANTPAGSTRPNGPEQSKPPAPASSSTPSQPTPALPQAAQGAPLLPSQPIVSPPIQQHPVPPQAAHPPQVIQPHPPQPHPQAQPPPTNINPSQVPPGAPNGYRPPPPNGAAQPLPKSYPTFDVTRTKSAPPNLQEQEKLAAPMFMPEKYNYPPPGVNAYYQPNPNFHPGPHMHVMPPPFGPPIIPQSQPVPMPVKKQSSRIPIIDPSTGQEVRLNSPPKPGQQTLASTPPQTTTPNQGLTGYNKPFVPASKAATITPPPVASPASSSAPQQVKVVGGILPELTPPLQPQVTTPAQAATSTTTSSTAVPEATTEVAEPTKSVETAKPVESTKPAEPTKSVESTKPVESTKLVEPAKPAKHVEPTTQSSVDTTKQHIASTTAPAESTKPSEPAKSSKSAEPTKPSEPAKSAESTKPESTSSSQKPTASEKAATTKPASHPEVSSNPNLNPTRNSSAEASKPGEEKTDNKQLPAKSDKSNVKTEEKPAKAEEKPPVKAEEKSSGQEKKDEQHQKVEVSAPAAVVTTKKGNKNKILQAAIKNANEGNLPAADFDAYAIKPKEQAKEVPKAKEEKEDKKPEVQEKESENEPEKPVDEAQLVAESEEPADDWEKVPEEKLVVRRGSTDVSLRPGGAPFHTQGGKKMYDRNFLLQFQSLCTERPDGLPPMEVILGDAPGGPKRNPMSGPPGITPFPSSPRSKPGELRTSGSYPPRNNTFSKDNTRGRMGPNKNQIGINNKLGPTKPLLPTPILVSNPGAWSNKGGVDSENGRVLKKAKGILNKITLDKFEPLSDKLLDVGIVNADILKGIIAQVFEKALSEPKYVNMYAQLCRKISESKKIPEFPPEGEGTDKKPITFKRILLNKCQEEFEQTQLNASKREHRDESMTPEQLAEIEDKENRARKSYLGNIKFIGELYKLEMLTEKIMIQCITRLLGDVKNPKEEDMEALCKLMSTIGERLDHPKSTQYMSQFFTRITDISLNANLPARIRFMMEDLIALRKNKWIPRRDTNAPKTIKEVHKAAAEAEKEKEKESFRMRTGPPIGGPNRDSRGPPMGGGRMAPPDRGAMGYGGGRGNAPTRGGEAPTRGGEAPTRGGGGQDGWEEVASRKRGGPTNDAPRRPPGAQEHTLLAPAGGLTASKGWSSTQQGGDKGAKQDDKFGNRNAFSLLASQPAGVGASAAQGNKQVARAPSPPPSITAEEAEKQSIVILEEFLGSGDAKEASTLIKELNASEFHADVVNWILMNVLEKKEKEVLQVDSLFKALRTDNIVTVEQFSEGLQKILEFFTDLVVDLPKSPKFMGIIIGGAIARSQLPLSFLTTSLSHLVIDGVAPQIGLEVFDVIKKTGQSPSESEMWAILPKFFGPNFTERQILTYLTDKKMSHIFPTAVEKAHTESVKAQLESMIKDGSPVDSILKWIEHNAPDIQADSIFARWLMRTVLAAGGPNGEVAKLQQYALLLVRFLQSPTSLQLPCLFEVQSYWASIGAPKEMLPKLFAFLYDHDVILEEAFKLWVEDCKDTTPKKEDAVYSTSKWITWLETAAEESGDEEDTK